MDRYIDPFIDMLRINRAVRTDPVESAFRSVPRHFFVDRYYAAGQTGRLTHVRADRPTPNQLSQIYSDRALVSHRNPPSSTSQPSLVAMMLEHLSIRSGNRILEIGAGTGWNAGLMGHLSAPDGSVHTIDIQSDVSMRARKHLKRAGAANVTVHTADGSKGWPRGAPYDRLVTTVSTPDIPSPWIEQLAGGGTMLLTLQEIPGDGWCQLVKFRKRHDFLRGSVVNLCGFMPLQGSHRVDPFRKTEMNGMIRRIDPSMRETRWPAPWAMANTPDTRRSLRFFAHLEGLSVRRVERSSTNEDEHAIASEGFDSLLLMGSSDEVRVFGSRKGYDRLCEIFRKWVNIGAPQRTDYDVEAWPSTTSKRPPRNGWLVRRGDAQLIFRLRK